MVLSYGDQPEIWRLHAWVRIEVITDRELVITPADELSFLILNICLPSS
jgi:hypothetical protein